MRIAVPLTALLLLFGSMGAQADDPPTSRAEPTAGPFAYHQLRTYSAVSGAGFGVDEDGYLSLSGPVAYSTPVANTLGHNRWHLGGDQYSFSTNPVFTGAAGNWDFFLGYGFTVGHFNIFVSDNFVNEQFTQAFNIQFQYVPPKKSRWRRLALAAGIEDIGDTTKTVDNIGAQVSSFSYFGVATYRIDAGRYPIHLTLGTGNRRFAPLYGSVTMQIARPLRLWSEEDRFGNVSGLLYVVKVGSGRVAFPWTCS